MNEEKAWLLTIQISAQAETVWQQRSPGQTGRTHIHTGARASPRRAKRSHPRLSRLAAQTQKGHRQAFIHSASWAPALISY